MQNTPNYNLKKPDYTDFADVMDLNDDMDIIDETLADKLDKTGDASEAKVATATASSASYPIPAAGDTFKAILGKLRKFMSDIKAAFVDASVSGTTITLTKADGTTKQITTQDTTYSDAAYDSKGLMTADTYRRVYNRSATDGSPVTTNAGKFYGVNAAGNAGWQSLPTKNDATTAEAGYMLDARMGKTINDKIDSLIQTSTLAVTGGNDLLYYNGTPIGPSNTQGYFFIIMHPVGNSDRAGVYIVRTYDKNITTVYAITNATVGFSSATGNLYYRSSSDTGINLLYTIIRMVNVGNV